MRKRFIAVLLLTLAALPVAGQSGAAADRAAVQQAALDYVEGIYTSDVSRIERSVLAAAESLHPVVLDDAGELWIGELARDTSPKSTGSLAQLEADNELAESVAGVAHAGMSDEEQALSTAKLGPFRSRK